MSNDVLPPSAWLSADNFYEPEHRVQAFWNVFVRIFGDEDKGTDMPEALSKRLEFLADHPRIPGACAAQLPDHVAVTFDDMTEGAVQRMTFSSTGLGRKPQDLRLEVHYRRDEFGGIDVVRWLCSPDARKPVETPVMLRHSI